MCRLGLHHCNWSLQWSSPKRQVAVHEELFCTLCVATCRFGPGRRESLRLRWCGPDRLVPNIIYFEKYYKELIDGWFKRSLGSLVVPATVFDSATYPLYTFGVLIVDPRARDDRGPKRRKGVTHSKTVTLTSSPQQETYLNLTNRTCLSALINMQIKKYMKTLSRSIF